MPGVDADASATPASSTDRAAPALAAHPQLATNSSRIAGIASINYRLSPYPSHPTQPSSPDDPDRNVRHPAHLADINAALAALQQEFGIGERYVLVGHSCGATLAAQSLLLDSFSCGDGEGGSAATWHPPLALVGVAGIYNLPSLVDDQPTSALRKVYAALVSNAFGSRDGDGAWLAASPQHAVRAGARRMPGTVVLAHSAADELVPSVQSASFLAALVRAGCRAVYLPLAGGHDAAWQEGAELARAVRTAVDML